LIRKDFTEIYIYAKKLGLIVTVFTSLVPLDDRILRVFKAYPPFNIETTLNAATGREYQEITKTLFFIKHVNAIEKLLKNNLPVKVKTKVTKQNVGELEKVKKLVESMGLKFRPSTTLHGRLNKDTHPCSLRLEPERAMEINEKYRYFEEDDPVGPREKIELKNLISKRKNDKLFSCAAGGHAFWVSTKGRMFICCNMRKPDYDLLEKGNTIKEGFYRLNREVHNMRFRTMTPCRRCEYKLICEWCPGSAYLETGNMEAPIPYYCELTKKEAERLHDRY
jgi:radical SAM protein with 4Fe4S-binding SPASM domain